MVDERTEQLINRKVDGELAEGELLELQKALIRSPEARALLEEYEAMNALACEALHGACLGRNLETQAAAQRAAEAVVVAGTPRGWLRPAMAVAAMIALVAIGSRELKTRQQNAGFDAPQPLSRPLVSTPVSASLTGGWEVPRRQAERIDGYVVGIYDEDARSYYFIELDRRNTTITPVSMNY